MEGTRDLVSRASALGVVTLVESLALSGFWIPDFSNVSANLNLWGAFLPLSYFLPLPSSCRRKPALPSWQEAP